MVLGKVVGSRRDCCTGFRRGACEGLREVSEVSCLGKVA